MAQNLELRHLCQMQNAGDRWLNSHSKQVSCAMYVPKNDRFLQSSALVSPHNFSQHQAEQNTFTKQNFVLTIKPFPALRHPCASQTWQFSRLRGVGSGKVLFCTVRPCPPAVRPRDLCGDCTACGRASAAARTVRDIYDSSVRINNLCEDGLPKTPRTKEN